jgi:hypothetical protein
MNWASPTETKSVPDWKPICSPARTLSPEGKRRFQPTLLEDAAAKATEWAAELAGWARFGGGEGFQTNAEVDAFFGTEAKRLVDQTESELVVMEFMGEREIFLPELRLNIIVGDVADKACGLSKDKSGEAGIDITDFFEQRVVGLCRVHEELIARLEMQAVLDRDPLCRVRIVGGVEIGVETPRRTCLGGQSERVPRISRRTGEAIAFGAV